MTISTPLPMAQARDVVPDDEEFIGQFTCYSPAPIWFYLILGPLYNLYMTPYLVSVSATKVRFSKCNYWGTKLESNETFDYDEIHGLKFRKLGRLATLIFTFNNGTHLKLKSSFVLDNTKHPKAKFLTQNILDVLQMSIPNG